MEVKINGTKNSCEHKLISISSRIKWCKKCGMIQKDIYNIDFELTHREEFYTEK